MRQAKIFILILAKGKLIFSLDTLAVETSARTITVLTLPQICFQAIVDVPQVQLIFAIILYQQQVVPGMKMRVSSQVSRIYKRLLMRIQKLPAQNALRLALPVIVQMTIRVVTHQTTSPLLRLALVLWTISVKKNVQHPAP